MPLDNIRDVPMRACMALALLVGPIAGGAGAQSLRGEATYRERMTLPRGAVLEAALEDVSRGEGPATTMAATRVTSLGNPPIAFAIPYDPARVVATHRYVVRARIVADARVLFTSDEPVPVMTQGSSRDVTVALRRVREGRIPPPLAPPLEETYWRAVEVAGHHVTARGGTEEAHLRFLVRGRVAGADGCHRLAGGYALTADAITFSDFPATPTTCAASAIEDGFRDALKRAARWKISGRHLQLLDAAGSRLAMFEAPVPAPVSASSVALEGTAWRLVRFQRGDETVLTPPDGSRYRVQFDPGGRLAARIDCNRGRGTWRSAAPNQLELGPLTLTRARCAPGSLHDQILRHWPYIWSFVVQDGHLFLSLTADRGVYEWARDVTPGPADR
jgi:uncharacterized lipoprotein YbaY/heat shock protein HslJ